MCLDQEDLDWLDSNIEADDFDSRYHSVYIVVNYLNDKIYIGKELTKEPFNRRYMGSGKIVKQAIKKYGKQNFGKIPIFLAKDADAANRLEKEVISRCKKMGLVLYNLASGGDGGNTRKYMTPQQYDKYINALTEAQNRPDLKKHRSRIAQEQYTPEIKAKIGSASKQRMQDENWKNLWYEKRFKKPRIVK